MNKIANMFATPTHIASLPWVFWVRVQIRARVPSQLGLWPRLPLLLSPKPCLPLSLCRPRCPAPLPLPFLPPLLRQADGQGVREIKGAKEQRGLGRFMADPTSEEVTVGLIIEITNLLLVRLCGHRLRHPRTQWISFSLEQRGHEV